MANKKYTEIAEEKKKSNEDIVRQQADEQTALVNKTADDAIARAERDTNAKVEEADRAYIDMINAADIQKELDIRDIRETRANMGLSRSGLASTETTAATLSAGNKTAAAQRQRQSAIDTLRQSLLDYKADTEAQRNAQNLQIKQTADSNIQSYGDKWDTWATENQIAQDNTDEQNRRNGILSLNIPDSVKTTAIENGWTVSQAEAKGKAVADQTENERKANLYAAWQNKEITEEIYRQAIADPSYDVDDALAAMATYTAGKQEENASFAASLLQSGAISPELYATAIRAGWDIPTIIDMANKAKTDTETQRVSAIDAAYQSGAISQYVRDYAKVNGLTADQAKLLEQEQEAQNVSARNEENAAAEKQRLADLDALYDKGGENAKIDVDTWMMAKEKGWSASLAFSYQKNKDQLDAALQNGTISKETYNDAIDNGYTYDSVIAYEKAKKGQEAAYNNILSSAKKMIYSNTVKMTNGRERNVYSEDGKRNALAYLFQLYSFGSIDAVTADKLAKDLGFSEDELTAYANENDVVAPFKPSQETGLTVLWSDKNGQPGGKLTRNDAFR